MAKLFGYQRVQRRLRRFPKAIVYCRTAQDAANAVLWKEGLALPGGTCPATGVSGLTLGGGYGVLSRLFGMIRFLDRSGTHVGGR